MKEKEIGQDFLKELLLKEQDLFGLGNWKIPCSWASPDDIQRLKNEEATAAIFVEPPNLATILLDPTIPEQRLLRTIDHELAHLFLNTGYSSPTGKALEHTQACHIDFAIDELRRNPDKYRVKSDDLACICEKSGKLTRLWGDEEGVANNWRIITEEKEDILVDGIRSPVFIMNQYCESRRHLGGLCARQAILYVDKNYLEALGGDLPYFVLKEMWWIVLSPYQGKRFAAHEVKINKIMEIMQSLGWKKGQLYD